MIVYVLPKDVTKTKIRAKDVSFFRDEPNRVRDRKTLYLYRLGERAFETKEEAIAAAEARLKKQIEKTRKLLEKYESVTQFEVIEDRRE